jgi:hypothetical protein
VGSDIELEGLVAAAGSQRYQCGALQRLREKGGFAVSSLSSRRHREESAHFYEQLEE